MADPSDHHGADTPVETRDAPATTGLPKLDVPGEWRHPLTGLTIALLLFESLTGFTLTFLGFSVWNQLGLLWHTLVGVLMVVPVGWYLVRHWLLRYRRKFNHFQFLGYLTAAALIALVVSGFVLTWQAGFGSSLSYFWDQAHLITGFVMVFALLTHVLLLWVRSPREPQASAALRRGKRSFLAQCLVATGVLVAVHVASVAIYEAPDLVNEFPPDYSWTYGEERPFAPSLVMTESQWAYDPASMAGSRSCGTEGCHTQILEEWEPSAHRYASSDVAFQSVQKIMLEDVGAEATRYCAGCHDPVALLSGSKNVNVEGLTSVGADEGVSCVVCHAISRTDVRGNADYTMSQPDRYVGELADGAFNKWVSDFLIRAYPQQHQSSFTRPLLKTPEFCGACHKQFINEEVNQIGWVQLQNQYDNWKNSRWYHEGDAARTVTCRECHMPLQPSTDPAAGDAGDYNRSPSDGKHRSHRTLGANQVMPALMELPGAAEQIALVEQWLRGEIEIPEIADKWTAGPVIRLELSGPEVVKPGSEVEVQVKVTNNKTGHGFPTGPLDIIRSWVELTVLDESGNVLHEIGQLDDEGKLSEDTMVFKAEGIDRAGNDIDVHNLWEMVGARFKRALFPGMSDAETYTFACPGFEGAAVPEAPVDLSSASFTAPGDGRTLEVRARLNYQKADAAFLDRLFGEEAGIRTPITELSADVITIRVEP